MSAKADNLINEHIIKWDHDSLCKNLEVPFRAKIKRIRLTANFHRLQLNALKLFLEEMSVMYNSLYMKNKSIN